MGRIKDTIVLSPPGSWGDMIVAPLLTRDAAGRIGSLLLVLRACGQILRARLNGSLALVHVNMGDRGSAVRKSVIILLSRLIGAPTFLHLHAVTLEQDVKALPALVRPLAGLPFRAATCIIVLGDRWKRWLRDDIGIKQTPIEVLVNGVPIEAVSGRDHLSIIDRPLRILFLGNLIARKGIDDLIVALSQLPRDVGAWSAAFAGNGDIVRYSATAERAGIGDRISFEGWIDHQRAQAMVSEADLLVLPSYHEGLPLVVLEALGLGTPVITTPVGAMPEFLTPDENVLFCPPGEPSTLAAMIARVLGDASLRQSLCDQGLIAFRRQFSVAAFREHLREIWEQHRGQ